MNVLRSIFHPLRRVRERRQEQEDGVLLFAATQPEQFHAYALRSDEYLLRQNPLSLYQRLGQLCSKGYLAMGSGENDEQQFFKFYRITEEGVVRAKELVASGVPAALLHLAETADAALHQPQPVETELESA